ncbi:MAG: hypothetical protein RRA92_07075 [Gemmatimonadota bacterium]|nr:hypothetical protein [Gemmatimonadota bacterium]
MNVFRRLMPLLLALALPGCSDDDGTGPPIACTEEFASWVVAVVDDTGTPVEGLEVAVTREATGALLPYGEPGFVVGSYRIMDDRMNDELRVEGETIVVEGEGEGIAFRADFLFGTDAARCHVEKISGPDTVVVGG